MEIHPSARKHGVLNDDITHAIDNALYVGDSDDDRVLHLGPDRSGNLVEVVSVIRSNDTVLVIHAMRMRRIYEPLLRDQGGIE